MKFFDLAFGHNSLKQKCNERVDLLRHCFAGCPGVSTLTRRFAKGTSTSKTTGLPFLKRFESDDERNKWRQNGEGNKRENEFARYFEIKVAQRKHTLNLLMFFRIGNVFQYTTHECWVPCYQHDLIKPQLRWSSIKYRQLYKTQNTQTRSQAHRSIRNLSASWPISSTARYEFRSLSWKLLWT